MTTLIKLTDKEEDIMRVLWMLQKAFVKDIKAKLKQKLHYNTVSTIIRNLEEKQYVSHEAYGNTHQYYPLVSQDDYQNEILNQTADKFFKGSYKDLVSFFAKEEKISQSDLESILNHIKQQK
jgi:predicted transcriptional regulator